MAEPRPRALAAYGALAAPLAFAGLPLYIHAPDFYAAEHGAPLAALGGVLAALRLADAAQDPLVGWLGDRYPARRGLLASLGALLLGLGFLALFAPPQGPVLWWFAGAMLLASFGHSLLSITLTTLGGLWRADPAEKSRISAAREGFGLAGLITAVSAPALLQPTLGRQGALLAAAGGLAVLLIALLPVFQRWLRGARLELTPQPGGHWRDLRSLSGFYAVAALVLLSAALPATLILMLARDLLGAEEMTGAFLLSYFAAALPGAWAAARLAGRFGAVPVWAGALALSALGFAGALGLERGDAVAFLAICVATGFTFGADLTLPPAILSERIGAGGLAGRASLAYAALAFLTKAALALAGALALPLLAAYGFDPGGANDAPALSALLQLYAGLPIALRLAAVAALLILRVRGAL